MAEKSTLQKVRYTKEDGTSSDRTLLGTGNMGNVLAIDVSDLDPDTQEKVKAAYQQYLNDFDAFKKTFPKFEDKLAESGLGGVPIKWRSFKSSGLQKVD